ncbi:MAG: hypothetical protein ACHQ51_01930 [Elusimicrobiota bacterium]
MTRKLAAVLFALAVALCFSRAGAWAALANHGDAHACCRHGAPAKTLTLSDCCATGAAVGAVQIVRADTSAAAAALPAVHAAPVFVAFVPSVEAPPGALAYRTAPPARAPPLA